MHEPTLFRDRARPAQIVLGGFLPAISGALAGVLVGVSSGAYWGWGAVAAVGGFLSGFEHQDGWGGADRGLVGGAVFGLGILLAHWIAGTGAKVSLGSFPPLLIALDAIAGMLLGALGGRIARGIREREQERGGTAGTPASGSGAGRAAPEG
jgi:hypothetical protein